MKKNAREWDMNSHGLRFKEINGQQRYSNASITLNNEPLFSLRYGDAARLWRINIGWKRRADKDTFGFVIDLEKGIWEKSDQLHDQDDTSDVMGPRRQRVVPFVEDRRNCLLLRPANRLDSGTMLSLQTALKKAVQAIYQLEDTNWPLSPCRLTVIAVRFCCMKYLKAELVFCGD